ncbi:hypothetical protein BGZ83_007136 [Gryganskiella cystojenkinii]|nr:hypothetical protein BGZ83_007136 [Gryganskiella cystojenkinii]
MASTTRTPNSNNNNNRSSKKKQWARPVNTVSSPSKNLPAPVVSVTKARPSVAKEGSTVTSTSTSTAAFFANPVEVDLDQDDEGLEFVGILYDCILYERAYNRMHTLQNSIDFPVVYEDIAQDFVSCYRLSNDPKLLGNPITARFSRFLQEHKQLQTAKGVQAFAHDHMGTYDIYPKSGQSSSFGFLSGEDDFEYDADELEELDEEELSDFDEENNGLEVTRKRVAFKGPLLSARHEEDFAKGYFAVDKHSQDMIAVMIDHLRRKQWYHTGSGGETVPIKGMGAERSKSHLKEKQGSGPGIGHFATLVDLDENGEDVTGGDWTSRGVPRVRGVKKYTRRYNGKIKRRNYERNRTRAVEDGRIYGEGQIFGVEFWRHQTPPTDYSDSELENDNSVPGGDSEKKRKRAEESQKMDEVISQLTGTFLLDYGSCKRTVRYLPLSHKDILYDWTGVNRDLRLIDLPSEDADPGFYAGLTKCLMEKYRELMPPADIMERHKALSNTLASVLEAAFPGEGLKVEPFGSFVSGILLKDSDADFCITGPNIQDHVLLNDMEHLGRILEQFGMTEVLCISSAMVPIVKFRDPKTNLECDLNTGNKLGTINSQLIRAYLSVDERVKPFLYLIKAICKAQGINDSKTGYLSSYALTWMAIVYLQQTTVPESELGKSNAATAASSSVLVGGGGGTVGPRPWKPVLPRLQQQQPKRMTDFSSQLSSHLNTNGLTDPSQLSKMDKIQCRFDINEDGHHTGFGHKNTRSLGRLILGFFEFYSRRFCFGETAIQVSTAEYIAKTSRELHTDNQRSVTFRMLDPFLHHRNITGTCRGDTLARVWRCFDHCYKVLSAGDVDKAWVPVE